MPIIPGWLPPSQANYNTICTAFAYISPLSFIQFITPWYPMGKTSVSSSLNIPGAIGWFTMEIPGLLSLLYTSHTLSGGLSTLPLQNKLMVGMFATHYIHRAILAPLFLNPSMSPIHAFVWICAAAFQVLNGVSLGAWIGAYGRTSADAWEGMGAQCVVGGALWALGLAGNWWHDEELRKIRRDEVTRRAKEAEGKSVEEKEELKSAKVYVMPERGLFRWVLYPHYFTEWVEWAGFWIFAGAGCLPAQTFFINEIVTMLPRAWNGWNWYVERFGREKVGSRKAVIPFVV
ncbi:3-oxo-5-alpha-steroid 4-dehydrogenase [Microthyrium microscopicum]|uniref:3-oxo-5-alpha-steroid 4-dehydrogenase n=1 Tax=Microthyrium microscopicum TaxID=703497 RepID=A0A6A6UQU2_9PEZI|nr:3-oxo-5-alpha-steroid 4-dehydrogenase [Microthyrium microscopicum]